MTTFRTNAIWLPRIVSVLLVVFTIDVAMAATCCPLPVGSMGDSVGDSIATMTIAESGSSDMMVPEGSDCPMEEDAAEHPDHNACCLACVAIVPAAELPDLDIEKHTFDSVQALANAPMRLEHPFRPPINHLL